MSGGDEAAFFIPPSDSGFESAVRGWYRQKRPLSSHSMSSSEAHKTLHRSFRSVG